MPPLSSPGALVAPPGPLHKRQAVDHLVRRGHTWRRVEGAGDHIRYAFTTHQFGFLARPVARTARGGFLGEFTGGAATAVSEEGASIVILRSRN